VLFLAGMWIPRAWLFAILLGVAALADRLAFRQEMSDWCVTAAYVFLIPAYACVWWQAAPAAMSTGGGLRSCCVVPATCCARCWRRSSLQAAASSCCRLFPGMDGLEYWRAVAHYFLPYAACGRLRVRGGDRI